MPLTPSASPFASTNPLADSLAGSGSTMTALTLPDLAEAWREPAQGDQNAGGVDDTGDAPQLVGTWACSITKPRSFREDVRTGAEESVTTFTGLFDITADIRPADEIRCNGARFEVVGTDRGVSAPLYLTVVLTKTT
jgi:hypothetical protein